MNRDEEQAQLAKAKLVLTCGCGAVIAVILGAAWALLKGVL